MRSNTLLWTLQIILAAIFLAAGVLKLALPLDQMKGPVALPGLLLRFVGAAEVLGAAGLILPGAFHRYESLVPLAATGLAIIMVGAIAVTFWGGPAAAAALPLIVGAMTVHVAWRRSAGR